MAKTGGISKSVKVEKAKRPSKTPKAAATKASAKSQEYVADSDDEDAAPEDRNVKKVNGSTESAAKQPGSHVKVGKRTEVVNASTEEESSEEDESAEEQQEEDSDAEEPETSLRRPNKVPPKVNGVKRSNEEANTSEGSSEAESPESELASPPRAKKSKTAADGSKNQRESGDGNDDGPASSSKNMAQEQESVVNIQPYKPPSGYVALAAAELPSTTFIPQGSLSGKQIWHITAPVDVSLSSITEIALDAIRSSKPVLSNNGTDYVLNEDDTNNEQESVLIPTSGGFAPAHHKISKTLHLQQKIVLPNLSKKQASQIIGGSAAADIARAAVSTVRPQPKGLRMRYKPFGFGSGKPGAIGSGSDSADEETPMQKGSSFQFPKTLGAHGASEDYVLAEVAAVADASTKKSKKKRKDKARDLVGDTFVNGDPQSTSATSGHDRTTASIATAPLSTVIAPEPQSPADVTMTNGDTPHVDSKEEKAKRKEERRIKRERKEAKAKSKQV